MRGVSTGIINRKEIRNFGTKSWNFSNFQIVPSKVGGRK
jgi:hypothetical protein